MTLTAHEVIVRPIISEKSMDVSGHGKYTFEVHGDASKIQVKAAVEELFKVEVSAVNVLTTKAKEKRRGTRRGRTVGWTCRPATCRRWRSCWPTRSTWSTCSGPT